MIVLTLTALTTLALPQTSPANDPSQDAFVDAEARSLLERARAHWEVVDRTIVSYQAVIKQRIGAQIRMPLKDRTVYRSESASRVWWSDTGPVVVRALAAREETPLGVTPPQELSGLLDNTYDPAGDRIYFGFNIDADDEDEVDFYLEHPFAPGSEEFYRFQTGDTLVLSFPDGRRLEAAELQVIPREASINLLTGSFWIEVESGALVRAAYRLAKEVDIIRDMKVFENDPDGEPPIPGLLKPLKFSISLVTVEYSLWDFKYWMPRTMRFEGWAQAGIIKAPGAMEISYQIEEVVGVDEAPDFDHAAARDRADEILEEWIADGGVEETGTRFTGRRRRGTSRTDRGVGRRITRFRDGRRTYIVMPANPEDLHTSEYLPPPIWKDAPGFPSEADLSGLLDRIASLPDPPDVTPAPSFFWGLGQADLVRYNRVEGLAVGARGIRDTNTPFGPAETTLTGFLGTADLEPSVELSLHWNGVRQAVRLGGYYELEAVDEDARHLGMGSSLLALLWGRDDGEYFRAAGARMTWEPASDRRPWFSWQAYAEHQEPVDRNTNVSFPRAFDSGNVFRENIAADEADQFGSLLRLRPYWGSEGRGVQTGLDIALRGEVGDFEFGAAEATVRSAFQLSSRYRLGLEAAVGAAWGDVPVQRLWYLGGSRSLRGYEGSTTFGSTFGRARVELARIFPVVSVSAFGDAGWAGERGDFRGGDILYSAGIGGSVLDGLIRIDVARALEAPTGWRLELYLDAIL